MQNEFRPLLDNVATLCQEYFGSRLIGGYLHGSILYGDAIPGVSDLDYMLVLTAHANADQAWLRETARALEEQYPIADEVHLTPITIDELRSQSFARFALTHNATLHIGQDALAILAADGVSIPVPDAAFAKGRLDFARHCFQQALGNKTPDCTGPLPTESCYVLRKFARYFVIIEGAYYLMTKGKFRSFRSTDVLPSLMACFPQHQDALQLTQMILDDPKISHLLPAEYLRRIKAFVTEMFSSIESTP